MNKPLSNYGDPNRYLTSRTVNIAPSEPGSQNGRRFRARDIKALNKDIRNQVDEVNEDYTLRGELGNHETQHNYDEDMNEDRSSSGHNASI